MASTLKDFDLAEALRCGLGLRRVMKDAPTMETAARTACQFLFAELTTAAGRPACALVRCYKTHQYGELDPSSQQFARRMLPADPSPEMRCLTLLGTAGVAKDWNDRKRSHGHQAIPLATTAMVERAPMVAQLFRAFGLDLEAAIAPSEEIMRDMAGRTYGAFFVPEAKGSPYIPAQGFVTSQRIRSVIGFGGSLPTGDHFAVILFSRVAVDGSVADRFRSLALDMKSCFFAFKDDQIFDSPALSYR